MEDPTRVFRAVRFEQRFGFHIGKFTRQSHKERRENELPGEDKGRQALAGAFADALEADPGAIMKRLQELDLNRFIYPAFAFDADKERLFKEMDTVLKWYNLSFKGKYNRVFYYLLGLTDRMPAERRPISRRRLGAPESTRRKFPRTRHRGRAT